MERGTLGFCLVLVVIVALGAASSAREMSAEMAQEIAAGQFEEIADWAHDEYHVDLNYERAVGWHHYDQCYGGAWIVFAPITESIGWDEDELGRYVTVVGALYVQSSVDVLTFYEIGYDVLIPPGVYLITIQGEARNWLRASYYDASGWLELEGVAFAKPMPQSGGNEPTACISWLPNTGLILKVNYGGDWYPTMDVEIPFATTWDREEPYE